MAGDRSQERAMRAAQRRAARRRQEFEAQVLRSNQPDAGAPAEELEKLRQPHSRGKLALLSLSTGVLGCAAIILGAPVLGQPMRPVPLIVSGVCVAMLAYYLWRALREATTVTRAVFAGLALVLPALLLLGLSTQVVIDGRAYLRSSVTAESFYMARDLHSDLLTLEGNQRFLYLDPAQAAGLGGALKQAREEDVSIAERWNPVVPREVPLPGFLEVMRLTNAAAATQAEAMAAYEANVVVRDPARSAEIASLAGKAQEYYVQAAEMLATTVAPLGIDFEDIEGVGSEST